MNSVKIQAQRSANACLLGTCKRSFFFGIPSLIMFDSQVPISDLATWLSQAFSVCLCKDLKWSHGLMAKLAKSYRHLPCLLPWFGLMTFYT